MVFPIVCFIFYFCSGDHSLYSGAFLKRHSSLWRLTDRGRDQAVSAGQWLRENLGQPPIYRYYVSEYIRAMETAGLMNLPNAKWFVEVQLRERDWVSRQRNNRAEN